MSDEWSSGQQTTLLEVLARVVKDYGNNTFLNMAGEKFTYSEIDRLSNRLANSLAALGVSRGDTVVTIFDNRVEAILSWFATIKLGGIWVPINTAYRQEFLKHQVNDAAAKVLICESIYLDRVVEIAQDLPALKLILCLGDEPFPPSPIPIEPFDKYRGDNEASPGVTVAPGDLAALLYTSGTTGPSKGCMISHNYFCMQGRQQRRAVPQERHEVSWTCLPMFHSAGLNMVTGALVQGSQAAIWPRFSVTTFWSDVASTGAVNLMLMASIFALVAHAPDSEEMLRYRGKVRMITGVPITPEIRKIWKERFGVKVVSSWAYGQTENSRLTMVSADETPPETCAGRAADEFEIAIFDENDCPVPEGEVGELVSRPRQPNVMFSGYWKRPEETARAWRNLWMHTGDFGRIKDGFLYFVDRKKDYLRARGENISSFEVEKTYTNHPAIQEVAVHAVGVQTGEDEIKVTAVLREGATLTEHELCLWSIQALPHFAVPRFYEFRTELIKNPTGRVLKYRLREEGRTPGTWDRDEAGIVVRRR